MLQDRPDYPELVHGFRPAWLTDLRGYKIEQQVLASFREAYEADGLLEDQFEAEIAPDEWEQEILEAHGLGGHLEDDYSEESMP
jgi:hypothetical protein